MADYNRGKTDAGDIVEAEKGHNLSPRNLHLRLRVVEVVLLVSLLLNLLHWVVAGTKDHTLTQRIDVLSGQDRGNQPEVAR